MMTLSIRRHKWLLGGGMAAALIVLLVSRKESSRFLSGGGGGSGGSGFVSNSILNLKNASSSSSLGGNNSTNTSRSFPPEGDIPTLSSEFSPAWYWYALVFVCGTMAAAAGVGGGALYTPIFILCFRFLYEAIPLSKAAALGASTAFFVLNVKQPPPDGYLDTDKYGIPFKYRFAYDIILVMEPGTLLGTVFGVLANRVSPYWLISAMMAAMLTLSAQKSFKKARKLRANENDAEMLGEKGLRKRVGSISEYESLVAKHSTSLGSYGTLPTPSYSGEKDGPWGMPRIAIRCIVTVLICYVSVLSLAIVSGGEGSRGEVEKGSGGWLLRAQSAVGCGTWVYWLCTFATVLLCLAVTVSNVSYVVRTGARDALYSRSPGYTRQLAVTWPSSSKCIGFASLCFLAGFFSSLVGIGGSTIKGPILLYLVSPSLAKATAQLMLLSTVSSSLFQFVLHGMVPVTYGFIFFSSGLMSGFLGKWIIDRHVSKNDGKQSTIAYALAFYIVAAAIAMSTIGGLIVYGQVYYPPRNASAGILWFRSLCDRVPDGFAALQWLFGN